MEEQKQQIEAIRDYWNQRANGFALAVDEELKLEEAKEWEQQFRESIQKPEARVLDDGTGAGFFPVILSRLGYRVTAIDYSDEMVAQAKERFEKLGIQSMSVRWMHSIWPLQMQALTQSYRAMCCGIWMIRRRLIARSAGCSVREEC